jgi:carboxyl-terminal processing protease
VSIDRTSPRRRSSLRRALCAGVAAASLLPIAGCGQAPVQSGPSERRDVATVSDVMKQVEQRYVVPVGGDKLVDNALKGMLNRLDPHSNYLDRTEYARLKSDMEGHFGGLGMQITQENGVPKVLAPIDGTPAAQAGIDPGDRIVRIDGNPTDGMSLDDVLARLRGAIGTKVTLAILRADQPPFDVTLTRAVIHVDTVKSALEPNKIGYVRISTFTDSTQRELVAALAALQHQAGGRLNGFVLDLREDPGGELDAAVDVAGDFLHGGNIVTTRDRAGDEHAYAAPSDGDRLKDVPMVVLIDSASASASEIVAGALKDHHRADLMGAQSFGKGSVQTVLPIETGGAVVLTTALYFTPAGRSIQGIGIEPDVVVPLPADQQVPNAVLRESDMSNALKNAGALAPGALAPPAGPAAAGPTRTAGSPDLDRPIKPTLLGSAQDAQLKAALDHLKAAGGRADAR